LFATLKDALSALNAAGIEPVLLKGCGMWAANNGAMGEPSGDRMVSDLDLMVRKSEGRQALDALRQAGFSVLENHEADDLQVVAVLGRTPDAGTIDLHDRPPGPVGIAAIDNLHAHCRTISVAGFKAQLPRPELQILILSLHDQIHDNYYWTGKFNLRHLIDIAKFSTGAEGVDWPFLIALCPTRFLRDVLETEILASKRIAAADVPDEFGSRAWVKAQYLRLKLQHNFPVINAPLRWLGRFVRWRQWAVPTRVVRDRIEPHHT
jgi:hypothetical protein